MLIENKISNYIIFEDESIVSALKKINNNKKRIIFIVNDHGILTGALSDGDFRRWIVEASDFNIDDDVSNIARRNIICKSVDSDKSDIEKCFSEGVNIIPLVDSRNRVVSVAINDEEGFKIGESVISKDSRSFIIAEIGNNHNGDIKLAKHLVDLAVDAGADCVKFQMRDLSSLYKAGNNKDDEADLGAQYTFDLLKKFQLKNEELIEVFDYCKSLDLTPLCTPWDLESLKILEEYGMQAYKVASADLTNHQLLAALVRTGKPLICSTGMSTEVEIEKTVNFLNSHSAQYVLLHCNSTYPTPFKDVNLSYISRLKHISKGLVGYSGHERGIAVPIAAIALGAKVIEKHFTIDKSMEGNDHKVSLLPKEFKEMVSKIRQVEEAMGEEGSRGLSQGEMINRENLAKSIVAKVSAPKGTVITLDMLDVRSPGQGLQPIYIDDLVGKKLNRDVQLGDYFFESDLEEQLVEAKEYHFSRPFGIPVRYHDYDKLKNKTNLDFVEFHLSYQDMNISLDKIFKSEQNIGFAVHSPELFANDHILNLASPDEEYRLQSISELNRVCDITRKLKEFFPKTKKPVIVVNAGGFDNERFFAPSEKPELYKKVAQSLSAVNQDGIELIIQTMPPFPWHFGGQSHHNLFLDPEEIDYFCSQYGYRICYDVSHSMMACNFFKTSLHEFTKIVGKHVAHMHIVDALGVDGEGIEVGKGDVNFNLLSKDLKEFTPLAQFIPEVWQGHKNNGEGFWKALDFLESKDI